MRDLFDTEVMGKLTPTATQIIEKFENSLEEEEMRKTTDFITILHKSLTISEQIE